jgi:hypothetical protein
VPRLLDLFGPLERAHFPERNLIKVAVSMLIQISGWFVHHISGSVISRSWRTKKRSYPEATCLPGCGVLAGLAIFMITKLEQEATSWKKKS